MVYKYFYLIIACNELYESLNILTFSSRVFMTHMRANFIAVSSAANIVILSVVLAPCRMFNTGTQNAADVLLSEVLDASVYM